MGKTKRMPRPGERDIDHIEGYTPGVYLIDVQGLGVVERRRYIDRIMHEIKSKNGHDSREEILEGGGAYQLTVLEGRENAGM